MKKIRNKKTGEIKVVSEHELGNYGISTVEQYSSGGSNRYDIPARIPQGQEYFQLPFNELAAALQSKQKTQDLGLDDLDKTNDLLSNLREGYDTKGLATEVRNTYAPLIDQLASGEVDEQKVRNLKNAIRNDNRIRLLEKSVKEADAYDKYRQSNKDFNLWVQPQLDGQGSWKQAKDAQGGWSDANTYDGYINKLTPYNYYLAEIDDAGKNLKANLKQIYGASASIFTGEDGNLYIKKKGELNRRKLDENDPQYKAALESVSKAWMTNSTPGANYLHASYGKQGLPFDEPTAKKIINDRLKTFTFSEDNKNESVDLAPQSSGDTEDAPLIPYGETPAQENTLFSNLDFLNIHKAGTKKAIQQPSRWGNKASIQNSKLGTPAVIKERKKDEYDQLDYNSFQPREYNAITNSVRNLVNSGKLSQGVLDKILKKESLTEAEQKVLYPQLQKTLGRLASTEKINSQYEGLPDKEAESVTRYYFGVKDPKADQIGTGNSGNVTIYDIETGDKLKLKDLKDEVKDSKEPIQISTQMRGNNTYNLMFGQNDDLIDPYQLYVGGKMYLLPSPKGWSGKGADVLNAKKGLDKVTNRFTNSYLLGAPVTLDKDYDAVYDDNDNTYKIYHNGKPLEIKDNTGRKFENTFNSPQEAATMYYSYKAINNEQ